MALYSMLLVSWLSSIVLAYDEIILLEFFSEDQNCESSNFFLIAKIINVPAIEFNFDAILTVPIQTPMLILRGRKPVLAKLTVYFSLDWPKGRPQSESMNDSCWA